MCEFDFEIKHIKGKENKVVDALNRNVHEMHVASLSISNQIRGNKLLIILLRMKYMHR